MKQLMADRFGLMATATSFQEIFINIVTGGLSRQADNGAMPAGHNGPYRDPETPVRVTSHWLQSFLAAHRLTNEQRFMDAAERCAVYLSSDQAPRTGKVFHHRTKSGKDACNGLIGPAWTIEGLAAAWRAFDLDVCRNIACEYFLAHDQNRRGLWNRVEPAGTVLPEDTTFNHQLWFCAAGSLLRGVDAGIDERVDRFLDHLRDNLSIAGNGRIHHRVWNWKYWLKDRVKEVLRPSVVAALTVKEYGYHAFNSHAFAMIHRVLPDHAFWSTGRWQRVLRFTATDDYVTGVEPSPYGYAYNPPGFEVPATHAEFDCITEGATIEQHLLARQLQSTLDTRDWTLSKQTKDPTTLTARIYECASFTNELWALELHV